MSDNKWAEESSHLQRGIYPDGLTAHDGWQPPLPSGQGPVRQRWTRKRGGWWRPATWNWCARATITSDAHGAGWAQNRSISSSSSKCRRRKVTEKNIWATGVEAMLQPQQHHGLREVSMDNGRPRKGGPPSDRLGRMAFVASAHQNMMHRRCGDFA